MEAAVAKSLVRGTLTTSVLDITPRGRSVGPWARPAVLGHQAVGRSDIGALGVRHGRDLGRSDGRIVDGGTVRPLPPLKYPRAAVVAVWSQWAMELPSELRRKPHA